jgi:hypothetical protein
LVPIEQSPRGHKIADLEQAAFDLRKFGLGRQAVARNLAGCRRRLCCASAGLGSGGLVHVQGSLLQGAGPLNPADPNMTSPDTGIARHSANSYRS